LILNHTLELTAINKNGEELHTSITISQTMQAGELAFIAFLRDISAEKKNQVELRRKTLQLLELNNSLALKNTELERINKELESFNYVASHDLQEPLRKIQIFSNRLIEKDIAILPQRTLEYIDKIKTSSMWMQHLIEDLLSFSQLSHNPDFFEESDLNSILEEVKNILAQSIEEKNVRIEVGHLPTMNVIPFQLSQLFTNIIGNSIRYGKENIPPHIRISSKIVDGKELGITEAHAEKYLHLTFSDNGIGFEAEYADKIFDLFKRLHTKGKYTGTGIGLSICKKIVHNHDGFIKAESKNGEGATFHIFLPENRVKQL
jgi:light-regulated signal transduction histidine kinase (bacteriophytochrome)